MPNQRQICSGMSAFAGKTEKSAQSAFLLYDHSLHIARKSPMRCAISETGSPTTL